MFIKYIPPLLSILLLLTSCGLNPGNENPVTATSDFVTATLPPTRIPPLISTHTPSAPVTGTATLEGSAPPAVEGKTTTQLNVRAGTSTASETLGMIKAYETIQVIGRDASGSWYQVLYTGAATGRGWVRAEYVQVAAAAQIPVIGGGTDDGSGQSGLVTQKINVRSGPGTTFETLGVLNPKDVVIITGRDANSEWMQIEYASAPDGKGWLTAQYLQVEDPSPIPVIGSAEPGTETPPVATAIPISTVPSAAPDGDSLQAPIAASIFSAAGTHTLQVNGEVSVPNGDAEDWIGVMPYTKTMLVEVKCSNGSLKVELWGNGQLTKVLPLACAGRLILPTTAGLTYFLRVQAAGTDPQYVQYTIKITGIE